MFSKLLRPRQSTVGRPTTFESQPTVVERRAEGKGSKLVRTVKEIKRAIHLSAFNKKDNDGRSDKNVRDNQKYKLYNENVAPVPVLAQDHVDRRALPTRSHQALNQGGSLIAGPSRDGSVFANIPNHLQWDLPAPSPWTSLGPTLRTTSNGPTYPGQAPPTPWMEADVPVVRARAVKHKPVLVDVGPNEIIRSLHGEIVTPPSPHQFAAGQPSEGRRPLRQVRGPRAQPGMRSSQSRGEGTTLETRNNNGRSFAGNQEDYLPPVSQQPLPLLNPNATPTGGAQASQETGTADDSEDEESASGDQGLRPPHPKPSLWFGQRVFRGIGPLNQNPGANQL